MKVLLLISIACLSGTLLAAEVRDVQSSTEQGPASVTLNYRFANWKALNRSWILSLAGSRGCEAILENPQGELELIVKESRLKLILNGRPLRILQRAEVNYSHEKGQTSGEMETLWLRLPDWVSIQIQIFTSDQKRRLHMSVYRQTSLDSLIPILEATQN